MKPLLINNYRPLKSIIFFLFLINSAVSIAQPVVNFSASPVSGCAPFVVNFTDQSTGNPTSWQWDLGNGTLSTQQNPTTTYFNSGFYTVTLTATNSTGSNTFTRSQYIHVDDKPTVDYNASIRSGCFPLRVSFADLSTGGSAAITGWEWDFGDGFLSTAQNPFHIYTTAGNYSVTLKVTNAGGCTRTVSRPNYIQVSPGVTVDFSNTAPVQCKPPETITFTNLSTGPGTLTYEWQFGDGGTSMGTNPAHTYNTGGSFNVTLITQSSLGCVDTLTKPAAVVIRDVQSQFTGPATVCVGAPANFMNTSVPVQSSSFWDFGDGTTANVNNPSKLYTAAGTYNVKLVNNYGTCSDSVIRQITVLPLPIPDFTAADVTDCKVPFTVNFSDLSSGATAWRWNFGDGGTSTQQNPSHTYTAVGNYNVTLVVTAANGCSDSVTKSQFVRVQAPVVAINNLPREGCVPYTIFPTPNVTSVDGVASYLWNFGDGNTSTLQNPAHTYPLQGTYTVKLIITTNDGCTDSSVVANAVNVGNKSIANFSATPLAQCAGQPVQFTNLTNPSDRWSWSFGDGIGGSTAENPSYAYQDTGVFTVRLIAWNNGCADTVTKAGYINALPPVARFNSTFNCSNKLQVNFRDSSVLPQSWQWNFGDGGTSTLQNPVHIYSSFGTYNVSLTVTNGSCSNTIVNSITLYNEAANFAVQDDTICTSQVALFQVTGINTANITSYFWDYGDGTSGAAGATATHTYNAPGLYTVSLTIVDNRGCTTNISKPDIIRVWGPRANFSFAPAAGCKPLAVTFTDLTVTDGVHPITKWVWNFGDGVIQTYNSPPFTHVFDTTGLFNPLLIVTDSYGCSNIYPTNVQVFVTQPKAIFSTADSLTCAGRNVRFTNASTGVGLTYLWNFGDGTTSVATNPVKAYAADGDYNVQLIATDVNGCKDSVTKINYIKVHTVRAAFTVSDSISSCTPFEVIFTNTSQFSTSLRWIFGDGTSSVLAQPTHYYSAPGTYIARLAVAGEGGCTDTINKTIIVYPSTATLTYSPLGGCAPIDVTFHASTPGPVTYFWDFNDGNTLATTDSTIVYTYTLGGQFLPKVILEDQTGCQIPVTGIDTIYITKSEVNFIASDSLFCDSGIVTFTDSTTSNATISSYLWDFGDGGTSTLQNPVHNYTSPGLYTVRLIVSTTNGCSDTAIKSNYIRVVASPMADIGGNTPTCMQQKLTFRGILLQPDTSALKWFWNFGNGNTSISQNPQPQPYDTAGNFALRLIVTNSSGCADTVDRNVLIYQLPTVDAGTDKIIGVGFSTPINPTGSTVVDYLWSPATGLSCTNCYNTIASPKNTTAYNLKVIDSNGCINNDQINITVICNNINVFIPNTFSPNNDGVNDWFYPRGTGLFNIQSMRIFNRWGEMVFQKVNLFPNDQQSGWNGKLRGTLLKSDVYTYIIEIVCENSDVLSYKGNITLLQ